MNVTNNPLEQGDYKTAILQLENRLFQLREELDYTLPFYVTEDMLDALLQGKMDAGSF